MQREPSRLHRALAVLAPPRRFQLLLLLLTGVERSVSQLARAVRLSQSCTTRHLQALERAGLVRGVRDGKRVVFRPAPRDLAAREVLASLARSSGQGLEAGRSLEAIAVASTAELEPLMARAARPNPARRPLGRTRARPSARSVAAGRIAAEPAADFADDAAPDVAPDLAPDGLESAIVRPLDAREPEPTHEAPESGITSDARILPQWRRADIEDYLL